MGTRTTRYPSQANFIVDPQSIDKDGGHQIDWANVGEKYYQGSVAVNVGAAGAAAAATTVPVDALPGAIPKEGQIWFGTNKFARLSAAAAAGATSLTVYALPTALVDADVGYWFPPGAKKALPAGLVVGEKIDLDAGGPGMISPRVVTTNPAFALLASQAVQDDPVAALSGYGVIVGGVIYEALLPDASGSPRVLAAAIKTELAANSKGFMFRVYKESR